jgi:hypothetical protein
MKARGWLLLVLVFVAVFAGCQKVHKTARPASKEQIVWPDPTGKYKEAEGFSLPLSKGVFLAKRFVSPSKGRSVQGKIFLIVLEFTEVGRLKVSLCTWKNDKVGGETGRKTIGSTTVTISEAERTQQTKSKYYQVPFKISAPTEKGKSYWLVVESDQAKPWPANRKNVEFLGKKGKSNKNNIIHLLDYYLVPVGETTEKPGLRSGPIHPEYLLNGPNNVSNYDLAFELKVIE